MFVFKREQVCVCLRESEKEKECVLERERAWVFVLESVYDKERGKVYERERESE